MKASERHKLKHDKAAETMVGGLDWARHHQSVIIAVFIALVVIVFIAFSIASSRRQAAEQSAQLLEDARQLANSVLKARAQGGEGDVDAVVRQFEQIASDNPKSDMAAQALLAAGQLLLRAGSADQALPCLERAAAAAQRLPGLEAMARRGMAEALEAMGKPDGAIEQHMKFTTSSFDPEAVRAFWDIGRCYEELKDREKAEEFYTRAVQYGEKSEWAALAAFRLSELAGGAELLGPVADFTTAPASGTATTPAGGAPTTTVAMPEPIAPEDPADEGQEVPAPPDAPAAAPETPVQKPDGQAQP